MVRHAASPQTAGPKESDSLDRSLECPPELPCVCDAVQTVRIVRGIPRTPSPTEQTENRRASSARLRVVERITDTPRRGSVS